MALKVISIVFRLAHSRQQQINSAPSTPPSAPFLSVFGGARCSFTNVSVRNIPVIIQLLEFELSHTNTLSAAHDSQTTLQRVLKQAETAQRSLFHLIPRDCCVVTMKMNTWRFSLFLLTFLITFTRTLINSQMFRDRICLYNLTLFHWFTNEMKGHRLSSDRLQTLWSYSLSYILKFCVCFF